MEMYLTYFNLISGTCSIVGLVISIFVASKVYKITNSFNTNTNINVDDKENDIGVAIASGKNSNASINVNPQDKIPEMTEQTYEIELIDNKVFDYSLNFDINFYKRKQGTHFITLAVDFTNIPICPDKEQFVGCAITSLPLNDWRGYVKNGYTLFFNYFSNDIIQTIQVELTNKTKNKKLLIQPLNISNDIQQFSLDLSAEIATIEDWKSVDEICFVFFPQKCLGQKGTVIISDLQISKNVKVKQSMTS